MVGRNGRSREHGPALPLPKVLRRDEWRTRQLVGADLSRANNLLEGQSASRCALPIPSERRFLTREEPLVGSLPRWDAERGQRCGSRLCFGPRFTPDADYAEERSHRRLGGSRGPFGSVTRVLHGEVALTQSRSRRWRPIPRSPRKRSRPHESRPGAAPAAQDGESIGTRWPRWRHLCASA